MLARKIHITFETIDSLLSNKAQLSEYTSQLSDLLKFMQSEEAIDRYSETPDYLLLMRRVATRAARLEAEAPIEYKKVAIVEIDLSWTIDLFKRAVVASDGQIYEQENFEIHIKAIPDYIEDWSQLTGEKLKNRECNQLFLIDKIIKRQAPYFICVEDLICPLTKKFMNEPMLASNGLLYERAAIELELAKKPRSLAFEKFTSNLISVQWINEKRAELIALNPQLTPVAEEKAKSTHTAVLSQLTEKASVEKPAVKRSPEADVPAKHPFLKKGTSSAGKSVSQPAIKPVVRKRAVPADADKPAHFSRRK